MSGMSGPIRLLLVVDSLDLGGAERHVAGLAAALRGRGCRVVVACSTRGALAASLEREGVPVVSMTRRLVKRRFSHAFALGVRRLLRREGVELVHAHVYASAAASAAATFGLGVPLVVTEHTEASWQGRRAREITRWYCRRARHVIAVSTPIRRRLIGRDGVSPEKISVIPTALPEVEPPGVDPGAVAPDGRLVGVVARLQPEKGVATFLRAVARIAPLAPDVRFLVVGDGPLREELAGLAGRLGLRGRVSFLGYRPDAREIIRRLDVLVVPSFTEGAPLVVLEAMASGVPVVASAVGGIPDQIRHGREGLLVPTGDSAALGEALLSLLRDPESACRMGAAGRRRAASAFGHDRMVRRIEYVYRTILAGRRGLAALPAGPGEERPPVGGLRSPS
ncbi:glycosyl transferase [Rubrobacter xylanophilus]|uniref:Glycosyl transferase n=1 Tax=Rubrobacter xylanophilus TaxID=49319 RepID=A0A510HMU4_9ACTN|nr:glycosyltransferase family 4 protein [Rubrobacter xylanophilus]BBL81178.1 glycosyl transferase [Rubrobacter xylanophilus]